MAAYPVYFMLGQESFLGDLSEDWITDNADAQWTGAEASIDNYDFQDVAVDTYNTTPAAANSNTQQAGDITIIGLDVSAARYLLDNDHPTGMALVKRTDQGVVGNSGSDRWNKTYAESWDNIAEPYDALETLITGRGDTVDVKGFFLSVGYAEAVAGDSTLDAAFKVDLKQFISDLRADYSASETTPVVMDLPPATVSGFTGAQLTSLANARLVIKQVAAELDNVSYVSADDLERSNGSTKWFYTGEATIAQGLALAKEMSRLVTGKALTNGLGVPVYVILGDDNCVGQVDGDFLAEGVDEVYSNTMANVKTWNWANETWEKLYKDSNSNTSTDGTSNFGPDISMGAQLAAATHPGKTVYVFKLGRNTSSVSNTAAAGGTWPGYTGDIYGEVSTAWDLAKNALVSVEEVVPDVRGLALIFGQADVATQTLADGFLRALRIVMDDYRALFQTRVDETLPIALVRMQDTGGYVSEYVQTVRDACTLAAAEDGNTTVVSLDSASVGNDGVSLSGSGLIEAGKLIAAAFG